MTTLRAMTEAEFVAWRAEVIPTYAAGKVESGQWPQDEALARSVKEYDELLPQGMATADHHLFTVVNDGATAVGTLWFAVKTKFNARIAYVFDISVAPQHQRQGHARAAFLALEDEVRRLGLTGIALHVFGHNHGALALYQQLGFAPTNISMFKALAAAA